MKKLIVPSAILAAGVAFLVGCGDENTTEITQVVGMQVLEAGEALPKCTADNEGAMVYSVDSAEAYYCVNRKWTTMKGEKGEDGKKGADGKSGSAGADGKDGASCTAKALKDGKGYKIVCGGDSVGVVLNGEKGDPGAKGDSGATGNNGLSAYEIAKAGGYTGSEEKWIEFLKGDPGAAGTSCSAEKVSDGVEITCTDGKTFTLSNGADGKDGKSFVDGWMVDPRDKQLYRVVTIGEQTWMAENLNYAYTGVPFKVGDYTSDSTSWCFDNDAANCAKYGRLYTWAAAMDSAGIIPGNSANGCGYGKYCNLGTGKIRGVCPKGWHLPSRDEWNTLLTAVGGEAKAEKMLRSTEGWKDKGSDTFGFSALPAGYRKYTGYFDAEGSGGAHFWSSSDGDSYGVYGMYVFSFGSGAGLYDYYYKAEGFSVRCLKD